MPQIEWEDVQCVELRADTVLSAGLNEKAKKPAYALQVDLGELGELGIKYSSAQLTDHYGGAQRLGRQVLCMGNFAAKRSAGARSEVLLTGVYDAENKVILAGFDRPLPNGARLA